MKPVIVDSTIWIEFLRARTWTYRERMIALLEADAARLSSVSVAELLYGARGQREHHAIIDLSRGLTALSEPRDTWVTAGDIGRSWRSQGRTLSLVDCYLASLCRTYALPLWTDDRDFVPLAEAEEIRLYEP